MGRKNKKGRSVKGGNYCHNNPSRLVKLIEQVAKEDEERYIEQEAPAEIDISTIYDTIGELSRKVNTDPINMQESCEIQKNMKTLDKAAQVLSMLEKNEEDNKLHVGYFTERDSKVIDVLDSRKTINNFLEFIDSIPKKMDYVCQKYSEADRKRVDFEHNIELYYENCYQTWFISRMFKYTLMERRDYKNLKTSLGVIKRFIDDHRKTIDVLRQVVTKLDDLENLKLERCYCPRSDLELPVNQPFKLLPKSKQDELRKNLELARSNYNRD